MSDPVTEAGGGSNTDANVEQSQTPLVPLPYTNRRSALHGMGLFATRNIRAGELILNKRPLISLLCPEGELRSELYDLLIKLIRKFGTIDMAHALWCILGRQPTLHGISLLNFQRLLYSDVPQNKAALIGALQRAGLGYYIPAAGNRNLIIDPHLCLFNHACVPNAELSFDHSIATDFATEEEALFDPAAITIRATKTIPTGAEITISYIHLFHTKAERAHLLAFDTPGCRCADCNLPPGPQEFSDMYYDSAEDKMGMVEDFRFRRHRMPRDRSALFDGAERDFGRDADAVGAFAEATNSLLATAQGAEMYTCALFFASDGMATVFVEGAQKTTIASDRAKLYAGAMRYKLKEIDLLVRCLGWEHEMTRATLDQLPDLAVGDEAEDMYRAFQDSFVAQWERPHTFG